MYEQQAMAKSEREQTLLEDFLQQFSKANEETAYLKSRLYTIASRLSVDEPAKETVKDTPLRRVNDGSLALMERLISDMQGNINDTEKIVRKLEGLV